MTATATKGHNLRETMSTDPVTLPVTATVLDAAREMRSRDVGDVMVLNDGKVCGVVTDRDLVVRALAEGSDPQETQLGGICSASVVTVGADGDGRSAGQLTRAACGAASEAASAA